MENNDHCMYTLLLFIPYPLSSPGYAGQLPPPPPANFPPTTTEYTHITQRPLPPVPGYEMDCMTLPYNRTSIVSVSPSEMSLVSHQSSESSRSLSPPIGPSYSPGQSRVHLDSVREADPVNDLQAALINRLKQRKLSSETCELLCKIQYMLRVCANVYSCGWSRLGKNCIAFIGMGLVSVI